MNAAEFLDRGDAPLVDLADLDFLGDRLDAKLGCLGAGGVAVRDADRAVVVDVDLGAGRFLDALDVLAARPDEQADLLGVDLDLSRRGAWLGDLFARPAQSGQHRFRESACGLPSPVPRRPDDRLFDAVDLDVELDAGDAVRRCRRS